MKSKQNWSDMLPTEIIYQHENITHGENGFTKPDLIAICNGKEETARALFDLLDWQHPATLLDEWYDEGEIDEHYNLIPYLDIKTVLKLDDGTYKVNIPPDAHAFDIDSNFLYYWRLKVSDEKITLPITAKWEIYKENKDHLILRICK